MKITKTLLLFILALVLLFGGKCSAQAASAPNTANETTKPGLLADLGDTLYEMVDGELIEATELERDKIYFISVTLQNVADGTLKYYDPSPDPRYNDELYSIWFQLKLPVDIGSDTAGAIALNANASRRNYDDRWNQSSDTLTVIPKAGEALALEYAPGYCEEFALEQINSYGYYRNDSEGYTIIDGCHSDYPIAAGTERQIMIALRTSASVDLTEKIAAEKMNHLRAQLVYPVKSSALISAIPIAGDVYELRKAQIKRLPEVQAAPDEVLLAEIKIPDWVEQQSNDQWTLQTECKVYAEEGSVNFWAGLYNHSTIYDLDGDATQEIFDESTMMLELKEVEAWYYDDAGEKIALELSDVSTLPEVKVDLDSAIILENNGIKGTVQLTGQLNELSGRTIYLRYRYSRMIIE